jgi:hypothetical protein
MSWCLSTGLSPEYLAVARAEGVQLSERVVQEIIYNYQGATAD